MLLKVFLLCSAIIVLVSANPLLQALNGQSYPVRNCQQDCRNQPVRNHQPSNNNPHPYAQQPMIQKQIGPSSQNQYDQLLYNKILSNPTLRALLDPNTKLVNQNGVDVPRQLPNTCTTGVPNVINNYIIVPPELLANELWQQDNQDRRCNNRRQGETSPRKNRNREGRRKNTDALVRTEDRGNQGESRKERERQSELQYDEYEREMDDDYLENDKKRPRSRKPQNDRRNAERRGLDRAKQNEKNKDHSEIKQNEVIKYKVKEENGEQMRIANSPNSTNINFRIKDQVSNKQVAPKFKDQALYDNVEPHTTSAPVRELVEYSRKESPQEVHLKLRPKISSIPQNLREEAVIQDICRKFPAIPENVVRNLLLHMKRQLQNEQLGSNPYYPSYPINYDQLYQTLPNMKKNNYNNRNEYGQRRNGRNRSKKRKQKTNKPECDCETVVELTPKLFTEEVMTTEPTTEKTTTVPVTTESTTTRSEKVADQTTTPKVDIRSEKVTEQTTAPKVDVSETTTQSTPAEEPKMSEQVDDLYDKTAIPELGTEDIVPTIYINGIVDDYYPDFTADNHAYSFSNEIFSYKNLKDDRYHYTTDKNIKMEELNRERRKYETDNKNDNRVNERYQNAEIQRIKSIPPEEIEVTISRPQVSEESSEELQFRPPPFLEAPDFETKQINKGVGTTDGVYYFPEPIEKYVEVSDKISTYSNAKTNQYYSQEKSAMKKKMPKTDVETVYARSKVVKFGHSGDEHVSGDKATTFSEESEGNGDGKQYNIDGDTTLVIAKSYPGAFW